MSRSSFRLIASLFAAVAAVAVATAACDGTGDPQPPPPPPPVNPGPPCERSLDANNPAREIFRYENEDTGIIVYLDRENVDQGVGHSSIYELRTFDIYDGTTCRTLGDGSAELAYENSHHNWRDRAQATIDGVRYTVGLDFMIDPQQPSRWRIWVKGEKVSDNTPALAETELIVTGAPLVCWACPSFLPVWITEVLPENTGGFTDEAGESDPWVELWNPSAEAVDISGWKLELGGGGGAPASWTLPSGTNVGRHQFLILWIDGEANEGENHAPFRLPASGATLMLRNMLGESAGERLFSSPGAGKSLDLDLVERRYAEHAPTPGATSDRQQ